MATLYIAEFQAVGQGGMPPFSVGPSGPSQIAQQPAIAEQTVAIAGASAAAAPFNAQTTIVRLHCDAICSVKFGSAAGSTVAATIVMERMPADTIEYFGVYPGQVVSVIANT